MNLICIVFIIGSIVTAMSPIQAATVTIDNTITYQTIEGFGGGLVFNTFPYNHPKKDELYDSLFNNAQINILRIATWYNPAIDSEVTEIPMMLEIQKKWPQVKTILTSWSPPAYLKSNNAITGENNATLKKNSDSTYMYDEYADYWLKSIRHFKSEGVAFDWLSIQNEPDHSPTYEGCVLDSVESSSIASYGKALNAVYTKCNVDSNENIVFIGPDLTGVAFQKMYNYVRSPDFNKNQIYAYCHHNYDYAGSDWLTWSSIVCADKPVFQTEFLVRENFPVMDIARTWHYHAQLIHQYLTILNAQMYCLFALTYFPASTHCCFSIDTSGGDAYEARPTWYMFKHFSKSIHRGWKRIQAQVDDTDILVSAFSNTSNDSSAVVLINIAAEPKTVQCYFSGMSGEAFQTTDSVKYAFVTTLNACGTVDLPVKSITTFDLRAVNNMVTPVPRVKKDGVTIKQVAATRAGNVFVNFSTQGKPATLSLYDLFGNRIATERPVNCSSRGTAGIVFSKKVPPGNYIVVLRCGSTSTMQNCIVAY